MTSVDPASESSPDSPSMETGSRLVFIVAVVIVVAGLSIVAAQLPPRIRLLGVFPLGFGLLSGFLSVEIAQRMKCAMGMVETVVIGALTCLGIAGVTFQAFQKEPVPPPANVHAISAAVEEQMRKMGSVPPKDMQVIVEKSPETSVRRFQSYLARRIRESLGEWSSPWPELLWGGELLIGTVGSIWITRRLCLRDAVK